jgi:hypothetical protein
MVIRGIILCIAWMSLSNEVMANSPTSLFDTPVRTQEISLAGRPGWDPDAKLICYYYPTFMVKEFNSGTPDGDRAIVIAPVVSTTPKSCRLESIVGEHRFIAAWMTYEGAKGNFLVMTAADPNGAELFAIFDRRTRRPVYTDSSYGDLTYIADERGALHLRYIRGLNTTCSLLKDGQACWDKTAKTTNLPAIVASAPPPVAACQATYHQVPVDDPSIITYTVDILVPMHGKAQVLSQGALGCQPMP